MRNRRPPAMQAGTRSFSRGSTRTTSNIGSGSTPTWAPWHQAGDDGARPAADAAADGAGPGACSSVKVDGAQTTFPPPAPAAAGAGTGAAPAAPAPALPEKEEKTGRQELAWAVGVFGFSAVGMTTGNKLAIEYLRDPATGRTLPATLVLMQMLGTLLLLGVNWRSIDPALITPRHALRWLPIFVFSATGMYTSAMSFAYVNVSFVIIMRNLGTFLTTGVEYFVRRQTVSTQTLLAEVSILIGIVMYGRSMVKFKEFWPGLFWCTANTVVITAWSVLLKHRIDNDPAVAALNKFAMSMYNNAMGVPYFIIAALTTGEHTLWAAVLPGVSVAGWAVILTTCGIGFMISTSGFALTRLVSATSYNVVNNLVKVVNILFGLLVLGDTFPGATSVAGCAVALLGGAWYGSQASREKERGAVEPCSAVRFAAGAALLALPAAGALWAYDVWQK